MADATNLHAVVARLNPAQFLRYVGASGAALAIDMSLFLLLLSGGHSALVASSTGYLTGIIVHWWISTRLVFADQVGVGVRRTVQKTLFIATAFVGLALTVSIVSGGAMLGIDPRLAKLVAIGVSFLTIFLLRKHMVFAR